MFFHSYRTFKYFIYFYNSSSIYVKIISFFPLPSDNVLTGYSDKINNIINKLWNYLSNIIKGEKNRNDIENCIGEL